MRRLLSLIAAVVLVAACSFSPNMPGTIVAVMPSTTPDHVLVVYQQNAGGFGTIKAEKHQVCVDEAGTVILPFDYFRFYHKHPFGILPKYQDDISLRAYLTEHAS